MLFPLYRMPFFEKTSPGDIMFISFLRTIILYLIIVVTLRVLGKRQVGELEPSELVVAILISDLAAVPMQDIGIPMLTGIIPIITLLAFELLASEISMHSLRFRAFLCGKPVFIIQDGKVDQKAMAKNRLTIDELFCSLRQQGVLNISEVQYAILETNGQLSTFLYPKFAPLVAKDDSKYPKPPDYPVTILSDGHVLEENLRSIGQDLGWLRNQLNLAGVTPSDIFLMTGTQKGEIFFIKKEAQK